MQSRDIGYKETIQRAAIGDRKYIRFFDGRGHFAHLRLQLTPRPGEFCVVTKSDNLEIPEPCYNAARAATFRRLEYGPIHHYPMFGIEGTDGRRNVSAQVFPPASIWIRCRDGI
jgi:hypothetical protein